MAFIVYALPRSRTFWLSKYLTYSDYECTHDHIRFLRSPDDIRSWLAQSNTGTVETAAAPFWRLIPEMPVVVIRRPIEDVINSMNNAGSFDQDALRKQITKLDHKLDQIEHRVPNAMSVQYDDLNSEETCKAIFEKCLPYPHDHIWWENVSRLNLQINMRHLLRYYHANAVQLEKLAKVVKHQMISRMRPIVIDRDDGITIQEEPFSVHAEARDLIRDHCVMIGDEPDKFTNITNIPLLQKLYDMGFLQVVTARSNGRIFGYLLTVLAPSLEAENSLSAMQTTIFASPHFPGLGMKMQRASIEFLKNRGVDEVFFRAGIRGSGERIGAIFKRIGASSMGELYKLALT